MTREDIEVMRVWIRQYYRNAGHERSEHMADALCDLALSALPDRANAAPDYYEATIGAIDGKTPLASPVAGEGGVTTASKGPQ